MHELDSFFSLLKDLSDASLADLESWFGPEVADMDPAAQTDLSLLVDRAGMVGDWISFTVDNMSAAEREVAAGGQYMVWQTAEIESTCDYCAPLDNKIVNIDEVMGYGYPPAHVNCMCSLVTIEEQYGELVPVMYFYTLPYDYETWRESGKPPYFLGEDDRVQVEASKDTFDLLKERMGTWQLVSK